MRSASLSILFGRGSDGGGESTPLLAPQPTPVMTTPPAAAMAAARASASLGASAAVAAATAAAAAAAVAEERASAAAAAFDRMRSFYETAFILLSTFCIFLCLCICNVYVLCLCICNVYVLCYVFCLFYVFVYVIHVYAFVSTRFAVVRTPVQVVKAHKGNTVMFMFMSNPR
jgi:hypothetical protein